MSTYISKNGYFLCSFFFFPFQLRSEIPRSYPVKISATTTTWHGSPAQTEPSQTMDVWQSDLCTVCTSNHIDPSMNLVHYVCCYYSFSFFSECTANILCDTLRVWHLFLYTCVYVSDMFYLYIYVWYSNIHPLYKTEKGATVILCLVTYSFWFNKHINHDS